MSKAIKPKNENQEEKQNIGIDSEAVQETGDTAGTEASQPDVQETLAGLQQERDEMLLLAQRVQADFDNYRKRMSAARAEALSEGVAKAMEAMLPVADNLDRALSVTEGADAAFIEGVDMVRRQLLDVFAQLGVEEIPAQGQAFDPNLHNAVMQCPAQEGQEPGMVADVMLKGYRMGERVLRYSMVIVAQ